VKQFLILVYLLVATVPAGTQQVVDDVVAQVQAVEDYLNSLQTWQASFSEISFASGQSRQGVFSFQAPDKFRWQYSQPTSATLVSTGSLVFFEDKTTGQISQLPSNGGLIGLLRQSEWRLNTAETKVLHVTENAEHIAVTLGFAEQNGLQPLKQLLLVFEQEPLQLVELVTVNPLDQRTHVRFATAQVNEPIAADVFAFTPPSFVPLD